MTFFLLLFFLSTFVWVASYVFFLWPSLLSPILWLVGSSTAPEAVASYIAIAALGLQLVLLLLAFLMHQSRRKLHQRLQREFTANVALRERTKTIEGRLESQEKQLRQSQSEAQELAIYKERTRSLQELVDDLRIRNQDLELSEARSRKEVMQLRSGKPAGFLSSVQTWIERVFP